MRKHGHALIKHLFFITITIMCLPLYAAQQMTEGARFVDKGVCPGEGCSYGAWKVMKTTPLRARPDDDSPIIGTLQAGARVQALTGEVHVVPGQFVVSKSHGRYKKGDVLWVYTYTGEGIFKVRFGGKIYKEDLGFSPHGGSSGDRCQETDDCWGELKESYQDRWWVRIKTKKGLTGWAEAEYFSGKSIYD